MRRDVMFGQRVGVGNPATHMFDGGTHDTDCICSGRAAGAETAGRVDAAWRLRRVDISERAREPGSGETPISFRGGGEDVPWKLEKIVAFAVVT